MTKTRREVIKNDSLKKVLLEKEKLTEQKNELLVEHDEWRKDFTKRLDKVKDKINKAQEKAIKYAKDINVMVGEFEEMRSVEVVDGEVVINIVDKISEFKEEYLKAKKAFEENKK